METERLLLTEFAAAHPADAARLVEQLPSAQAAALLEELPPETAATILERMAPFAGVDCLESMTPEPAAVVVVELPVDLAASLLRRLVPQTQESVLDHAPPPRSEPIRVLLRYPEGTAGALMDPLVQAFPEDITAAEAIRRIEEAPHHVYYYLYVVDRAHRLAGVINLRELMLAPRDHLLGSVMHATVSRLAARQDLQAVLVHPAWQEFHALPVVDESGVYLGAIRARLLRRIEHEFSVASPTQGGWPTLLALGELYWIGLWQMFQGLGSVAARREENQS